MKKIALGDHLFILREPLAQSRLLGNQCRKCGEVFLGKRFSCENCGARQIPLFPSPWASSSCRKG